MERILKEKQLLWQTYFGIQKFLFRCDIITAFVHSPSNGMHDEVFPSSCWYKANSNTSRVAVVIARTRTAKQSGNPSRFERLFALVPPTQSRPTRIFMDSSLHHGLFGSSWRVVLNFEVIKVARLINACFMVKSLYFWCMLTTA